jgi:hypothetical protein
MRIPASIPGVGPGRQFVTRRTDRARRRCGIGEELAIGRVHDAEKSNRSGQSGDARKCGGTYQKSRWLCIGPWIRCDPIVQIEVFYSQDSSNPDDNFIEGIIAFFHHSFVRESVSLRLRCTVLLCIEDAEVAGKAFG